MTLAKVTLQLPEPLYRRLLNTAKGPELAAMQA
jgi:hypothetical protein